MTEADIRRNKIAEEIGATTFAEDAGFLFPDGTMISMVDETGGGWERGHQLLIDYYDDLKFSKDELDKLDELGEIDCNEYCDAIENMTTEAVSRFLKEGNIRLVPDAPGFAISSTHQITKEQKFALYDIVDFAKNAPHNWQGKFHVDIQDKNGNYERSLTYDVDKVSVAKIVRDLEPNKELNQER